MRKPEWLRVRIPSGPVYARVSRTIRRFRLHTVCEEAACPNIAECWGGGTATIMLMGDICTRACRFCNVKSGHPNGYLDANEPERVACAVKELGLSYVVLTSVCRDDLPDGGAHHFARTITALKQLNEDLIVEVLIPDFNSSREALETVIRAGPEVIAHNVETVPRLSPLVRDHRASFERSVDVLRTVKEIDPSVLTKSSLMLGLGEEREEVIRTLRSLREAHVDIVTLGQYLRPTLSHVPVMEYVRPEVFEYYRREAESIGFLLVVAGPLVRSSYRAGEHFTRILLKRNRTEGRTVI